MAMCVYVRVCVCVFVCVCVCGYLLARSLANRWVACYLKMEWKFVSMRELNKFCQIWQCGDGGGEFWRQIFHTLAVVWVV